MKSYWIWNYGDYEIYHTNLVNSRRQEYGADCPSFWHMSDIERNVKFNCELSTTNDGYVKLFVNGLGHIIIDGQRHKADEKIFINTGEHTIQICVSNLNGLPAAYIESDVCATDGNWYTLDGKNNKTPVGYNEQYYNITPTPETFIFSYERIKPVSREKYDNGILFDFGKELFGYLIINNVKKEDNLHISYGESKEEATDIGEALLYEDVSGYESYKLRQRAFRYIYITSGVTGGDTVEIEADYEYLPLEYKGSFRCNDEAINKIYDACAYTLHLNTREVFLDGIKRDRWLWSGDAYQSYKFSNYLFF